jgi:hypothetical protein
VFLNIVIARTCLWIGLGLGDLIERIVDRRGESLRRDITNSGNKIYFLKNQTVACRALKGKNIIIFDLS